MYCNKCGKKINDNANFCSVCGAKVETLENQEKINTVEVDKKVNENNKINFDNLFIKVVIGVVLVFIVEVITIKLVVLKYEVKANSYNQFNKYNQYNETDTKKNKTKENMFDDDEIQPNYSN